MSFPFQPSTTTFHHRSLRSWLEQSPRSEQGGINTTFFAFLATDVRALQSLQQFVTRLRAHLVLRTSADWTQFYRHSPAPPWHTPLRQKQHRKRLDDTHTYMCTNAVFPRFSGCSSSFIISFFPLSRNLASIGNHNTHLITQRTVKCNGLFFLFNLKWNWVRIDCIIIIIIIIKIYGTAAQLRLEVWRGPVGPRVGLDFDTKIMFRFGPGSHNSNQNLHRDISGFYFCQF
jgi:hypothetical protein